MGGRTFEQERTLAITCSENGGWAYFRETKVINVPVLSLFVSQVLSSLQCYVPDSDVVSDFVSTKSLVMESLGTNSISKGDNLQNSLSLHEKYKIYCDMW